MIGETPLRVPARRGFSLSYRGRTLLSTVDPVARAEGVVRAAPKQGATLYLCPSPLYGYGLALLLESMAGDSAVLCVEVDEKLLELSYETIDRSILEDPRFLLARAGDGAALAALVRETWGSRRFRRVEELRLSGGRQIDPARYDALADTLRREIALDWGNAMTLVRLGRRYARNALRNLALGQGLSGLDLGAAPALVLGAGPSLDSFLDSLAGALGDPAGERAFSIICVDTALSSLYQRGIKPDLAVALESQHWNLRDFIGLGDWDIPIAMDLSALGATAEMLGGHPRLFFTPWTDLSLFDRLGAAGLLPERLPPLGSVGLSAVALACRLCSGPIVLAGMDFSFTLDLSHARSAPAHLEKLRRQTRLRGLIDPEGAFRRGCFPAVSKTGDTVRSNRTMENYRNLFQREFAAPEGRSRIRDVTGSGLDLGLETLSVEGACAVLTGGGRASDSASDGACGGAGNGVNGGVKGGAGNDISDGVKGRSGNSVGSGAGKAAGTKDTDGATGQGDRAERLALFVEAELAGLRRLRGILTGEIAGGLGQLGPLLDSYDYLWAHFPDCAGAGGRRPDEGDLGFLKRVRAEIDPFIGILEKLSARP